MGDPLRLVVKEAAVKFLLKWREPICCHGEERRNMSRIAFSETCEYPNETRIVVHTTLELREGKIVGQVDVVVREAREEAGEGSARGNREEEETVGRRAFDRVPIENLRLRRRSRDFSDSFEQAFPETGFHSTNRFVRSS
jgi:hypothetical protein